MTFRARWELLGPRVPLCVRSVALVAALISLGMQQPDPEANIPDYEKQIPIGHMCIRSEVYAENLRRTGRAPARDHACDCKMTCSTDDDGNVTEHEDVQCKAFCHVNGRACLCHTEEPCPASHPGASALMNMDGAVVAVFK